MPTYVSTTVFDDGIPVAQAIEQLINLGITNIELGSTHNYEPNLYNDIMRYSANFITHNFFPATADRPVLNIASQDEKIRRDSIDFMRHGIEFAKKIGAATYTIHPGFLVDPDGEGKSDKSFDFQFNVKNLPSINQYEKYVDLFLSALDELADYAVSSNVQLAVETQGSVTKPEFMLFSRPSDFEKFLNRGYPPNIGINLNLGHTRLASIVSKFRLDDAIVMLRDRIFAVEVSHNDGHYDDHKSLVRDGWYVELLRKYIPAELPIIFEARNVTTAQIIESCKILDNAYKS